MTVLIQDDDPAAERLWPSLLAIASGHNGDSPTDLDALSDFWRLYAPIAQGEAEKPFVVAQLGQSLDGRIATETGHSHYINGPESLRHLHRLRALVDIVVVGIGTVIADDPQLTVRKTAGPNPARAVIDPNFRLSHAARMLCGDGAAVFTIQGCDRARPGAVCPIRIAPRNGILPPADIADALFDLGFRRILIEGGAATVSAFLAAGMIDRLHVSVAPILLGSGSIGVNLPPIDRLYDAIRPQTFIHRLGQDVLFDCVLRR